MRGRSCGRLWRSLDPRHPRTVFALSQECGVHHWQGRLQWRCLWVRGKGSRRLDPFRPRSTVQAADPCRPRSTWLRRWHVLRRRALLRPPSTALDESSLGCAASHERIELPTCHTLHRAGLRVHPSPGSWLFLRQRHACCKLFTRAHDCSSQPALPCLWFRARGAWRHRVGRVCRLVRCPSLRASHLHLERELAVRLRALRHEFCWRPWPSRPWTSCIAGFCWRRCPR